MKQINKIVLAIVLVASIVLPSVAQEWADEVIEYPYYDMQPDCDIFDGMTGEAMLDGETGKCLVIYDLNGTY